MHALLQRHVPGLTPTNLPNALAENASAWDASNTQLWFAGQPLDPTLPLAARLGRNEKTRAVVMFAATGGAPPPREPVGASHCAELPT